MLTDDDATGWIMLLMRALSLIHIEKYDRALSADQTFLATGATDWPRVENRQC